MFGNVIVLLGLGCFMKIFFKSAEWIRKEESKEYRGRSVKMITIHVLLGVLLIAAGRML